MTFDASLAEGRETPPMAGAPRRWLRPAWARLILLLVLLVLIDSVVGGIDQGLDDVPVVGLPVGVALAVLVLLAYLKVVRLVERREVAELARDGAVAETRRGTLIGIGLFVAAIGIIAMFGGYRASWGSLWVALTGFGLMCAVAVTEELMFRGVLFRIVEEMAGTRGALVVSALAFGMLHLVNPHATIWGAIAIAIEAGLMFGATYAATRTLWLPIGMHLGWNFAEGGIFGVTVSGSHGTVGLLKGTLSGSAALTGGSFGPEGSLVAILICGIPTVLFLRLAARRGRIHPRPRRAAARR
ncbi:lysostaphin resistance A-like protein [Actinoallomurus sp. CA-150999]|uniref:CPBP family intramembrane glutamic endopeptidase n=1 Tax=Actinoallomurus sp. CA-150999 TaxID=3239887 RepID=UPI003D91EC5E